MRFRLADSGLHARPHWKLTRHARSLNRGPGALGMEQQVPVNLAFVELESGSPAVLVNAGALHQPFQVRLVPRDDEAVTVLRDVLVNVPGRVLSDVAVSILPTFALYHDARRWEIGRAHV